MRAAIHVVPKTASILSYRAAKQRVLDDFTVEYITSVLAATNGCISKAAILADMDRTNFRRIVHAAQRLQRRPGR